MRRDRDVKKVIFNIMHFRMKSGFLVLVFLAIATLSRAQDGSREVAFAVTTDNNPPSAVRDIAVLPNNKVIVSSTSTARSRIGRINLDDAIDLTFNPGSGANNTIHSVAVQRDGKVLAGGEF